MGKQGGDQPGGHCSLTGHGAGQEPCRLGAYLEKVLVRQHVAQQGRQQGGEQPTRSIRVGRDLVRYKLLTWGTLQPYWQLQVPPRQISAPMAVHFAFRTSFIPTLRGWIRTMIACRSCATSRWTSPSSTPPSRR